MHVHPIHRASIQKFLLTLAMIFDLLGGGFACYVSADPLVPFLAYALGVAALYTERWWILAAFASLGLSAYGAVVLRGEPVPLLIVAAVLKCCAPFLRGWLVLKCEVRELVYVVGYLRENPQAFFVFPFMLLLELAAVKLAFGDSVTADRLAVYAYYQLVGAVVAAFTLMMREGGSSMRSKREQRV
jgi:hypothetical protein